MAFYLTAVLFDRLSATNLSGFKIKTIYFKTGRSMFSQRMTKQITYFPLLHTDTLMFKLHVNS